MIATKKTDTNILPLDWPVAEKEIVSYSHANGTTYMIKSENCWNERKIANAGCVDKLYVYPATWRKICWTSAPTIFLREVEQDREGPNSLESPDSTHPPANYISF